MKYQVIARRYRPRRFEEVVGQESVGTTLRNAILHNRLAHAYLFAGPRGVGKTSMARIFAKALNCPKASDRSRPTEEWALPCDDCDVCKAIHAGDDMDVLEVDGASYRGIEDVRDIVENVKFIPTRAPYKIFIIDEIHMLTREAFNALLKTLEEPPAHVKFIFATTEAHKIPETVLSRCQRFDFRPIGDGDIVKRLQQICIAEGVEAEPELLEKIARYGKGGLRDAQTLLDQAITFSQGKVEAADLERITGRLPDAAVDALMVRIDERDPAGTLRAVDECFAAGADPAILLDQVIERARERLLEASRPPARAGGPNGGGVEAGAALDTWLGRLQVLHESAMKLRGSPQPRLAVELSLVKIARMADPRALDEALAYLKSMAVTVPSPLVPPRGKVAASRAGAVRPPPAPPGGTVAPSPAAPAASGPQKAMAPEPSTEPAVPAEAPPVPFANLPEAGEVPESAKEPEPASIPEAAKVPETAAPAFDFAHLRSLWDQIQIETNQRFPRIAALVEKARLREGREAGRFVVVLDSEFNYKQLRDQRLFADFEALVGEVTGSPWRMNLELEAAAPPGPGVAPGRTGGPAGRAGGGRGGSGNGGGGAELRDDPLVKKTVDVFKGKIV